MSRSEPTKTIGDARAAGETALTAHCLGCYHQAAKTFEELKLWNDMIFVDVPQHRRLVCSKCGNRNVKVMPFLRPEARRRRVTARPLIVKGGYPCHQYRKNKLSQPQLSRYFFRRRQF
jgi:hypothetical protein